MQRQQSSTSYPILFLLVSSTDHIAPVTGVTPTVTISKNGAGFGAPSGAVSELANGWYALAGNATDRATLGQLLIHATGTGADPVDMAVEIVGWDPFAGTVGLIADQEVNVTKWKGATAADMTGDAYARLGAAGAGLTALGDARLANLDASVSSRSTYAGGAVASVTGNVGGNVAGSVASVTADVGITQAGADKVWGSATRTLSAFGFTVTAGTVNDKTGYSLTVTPPTASDVATAVWGATTRTLSGFGTLVADVATAVWAAATRTLSAFGFSVAPTAGDVADAVWDEALSGHATTGTAGKTLADLTSGGGGSAPTVDQIDAKLTASHGAGAWGGAVGSGANTVTVTVTCATVPVPGAYVTVKNSGQTATLAGPVKTDANGQAVVNLDDGSYKVLVGTTPAYQPLAAATLTVSGTTTKALALTATTIAAPSDPSLCRVYAWLYTNGTPVAGDELEFRATSNAGEDGILLSNLPVKAASDADGYAYADLVQGANYTVVSRHFRLAGAAITIPAASTATLESLT